MQYVPNYGIKPVQAVGTLELGINYLPLARGCWCLGPEGNRRHPEHPPVCLLLSYYVLGVLDSFR